MLAPPLPPSPDEREALIREARARQLRRRLLGAAGVAVAAAFGLSAYAITIGGDSRANLSSAAADAGLPECPRAAYRSRSAERAVSWCIYWLPVT
jgi:hypothetical protein